MVVFDNVKFVFFKGVLEFDGLVLGGRNNLMVVSRERDVILFN